MNMSDSQKLTNYITYWDCLGPDLTELILSHLSIPYIVLAASVCKSWNSIIHSDSFKTRVSNSNKLPWFFICGHKGNQLFAYEPESDCWIKLPSTSFFNGQTSPLRLSRCNPLIGSKPARFFVALVDAGDCVAVKVYNRYHDSREVIPTLPEIFTPGKGNSLCSALFRGKLYVLSVYSGFVSCFDLENRSWSDVKTLRPPGAMLSYLISCRDQLVLAGLCCLNYKLEFNLWSIDEKTLEYSEIGIMPGEMLSGFLGDRDLNEKFPSLKCVGFSNIVFVFNEEISPWNRCACVCEISDSGKCSWRRVPDLPETVNKFDRINSFSSTVSLPDFLGNAND